MFNIKSLSLTIVIAFISMNLYATSYFSCPYKMHFNGKDFKFFTTDFLHDWTVYGRPEGLTTGDYLISYSEAVAWVRTSSTRCYYTKDGSYPPNGVTITAEGPYGYPRRGAWESTGIGRYICPSTSDCTFSTDKNF